MNTSSPKTFESSFERLHFVPSDKRLKTECGLLTEQQDAIVSTGRTGFLLYGPHVNIPPGRFRVKLLGSVRSANAEGMVLVELVAELGTEILWPETAIQVDLNGETIFARDIHSAGINQLEVRCRVSGNAAVTITGVSIERISNTGGLAIPEHDPYCSFLPGALTTQASRPLNIAILGTCAAEEFLFANEGRTQHKIDHFLATSWRNSDVPNLRERKYDAIIVHLTLRHVLRDLFDGEVDGDFGYLRLGEDGVGAVRKGIQPLINSVILNFLNSLPATAPTFFLGFLEPPPTHQGLLTSRRSHTFYGLVRELNDTLSDILHGHPTAHYIELNDLKAYWGDREAYDGYYLSWSHSFVRPSSNGRLFYRSLLKRIEQALLIIHPQEQVKIIVTDLDNTLWKGVLAEEDVVLPDEHIEGWPIGYVEALLECKRRGILLAIASKNDDALTRENFEKVWRNRISLSEFCSVKIGWGPKSESIRQILEETNLLPQNCLFIDDNSLEIAEVTRVFPTIRTLTGDPEGWRMPLLYSPETQVAQITEESTKRTELITAKISRDKAAQNLDRETYLKSLQLTTRLSNITSTRAKEFPRVFELLNKTNQFNTTGRRWSMVEIDAFFSSGGVITAATATDKFAQHGIVALALATEDTVEQVVMSCRVFGLGIEIALLRTCLLGLCAEKHLHPIRARFLRTGRNSACEDFYKNNGFSEAPGADFWICNKIPDAPWWIVSQEQED